MFKSEKKGRKPSPSTWMEFFASTSSHGFSHVTKGATLGRICWTFLLTFSHVAAVGHLWFLSRHYLNYDYYEVITVKPDVNRTFPDITICDNVRISDHALQKFEEARAILERLQSVGASVLKRKDDLTDIYSKEVVDKMYNLLIGESEALFANIPLKLIHHLGTQFDSLVASCKFGQQECGVKNFELYISPKYINCYTFKAQSMNSNFKNNLLGPEFGLSLILRGEPLLGHIYTESSNVENTNSIHLHIHPPNTIPFVSSDGLDINPGMSTSIELNQKQFIRLGSPYSECQPEKTVTRLNKEYIMEPNYCMENCVRDIVRERCNCTSVFFKGVTNDSREYCTYIEHSNNFHTDLSKVLCEIYTILLLGNSEELACQRCAWNCKETNYDIKISQAKWPQTALVRSFVKKRVQSKPMDNPIREYYEYLVNTLKFNDSMSNYNNSNIKRIKRFSDINVNGNMWKHESLHIPDSLLESQSLAELQRTWVSESFYRLNIYFSEPFVTVYEQVPSFQLYDFWSGIGGCMGLWAGASTLTILEFLSFLSGMIYRKIFLSN